MKRPRRPINHIWSKWRWFSLAGLVGIAILFRAIELTKLPPGLSSGEAGIGLSALSLLRHGTFPPLSAMTGYSPLWTAMQALSIEIFGNTAVALRIWPVIIGSFAVAAVWLWAKDWFGPRVGWVTATLMAVTPWAVTLSRSASPAILAALLLPLSLVTAGRAFTRDTTKWWLLTAGMFVIDLVSGPLGIICAVVLIVYGVCGALDKRRSVLTKRSTPALILGLVAFIGTLVIAVWQWPALHSIIQAAGITYSPSTLSKTAVKVAGMFNLHGDESFLHNFNSQPMLNAFVGLMFIAGLLVSLTRLPKRRYIAILIGLVIGLLPAVISPLGAPNDAHAAAALPIVLALSGLGTSYMLEMWYATFPINSAARSTGLAAILLLLGLTVFQGAIQVFRAWSGSAETYLAYDEAAVTVASQLLHNQTSTATRYVVTTPEENQVVAYLTDSRYYSPLSPAGVVSLPLTSGTKRFIVTASVRDETAKNLAAKYPGGKLVPTYSPFSQNELFYTYEITK